ncbi:MAG: PAS domain-containing protein, partial [Chthoniobacterales bacterium]
MNEASSPPENLQEEIEGLVHQLQATQQRLQELTGGELDAVTIPGGHSYLLYDAQEKLRHNEGALRKSEDGFRQTTEQLTKVLNSSLDVICTIDAQGCFTQISAACERIWGYRPDELLGRAYMDLVFPDDREKTIQSASEIRAGKSTTTFENRYLRKDGSLTCVMWSASWSEADQSMFGVARDVTEVREGETETRDLTERLKLAVKANKVGIWDWDIIHETMNWDDQMYELYGATPSAIPTGFELWHKHLHPDDRERASAEIERSLELSGPSFDTSFRIVVEPHDITRHIRAQGIVFRDSTGRATRMLGTNWDVTQEFQREEALRKKLQNEKALRLKASAGEKAKSEFLAVMSHEIRTPMNGILGFTELLAGDIELSAESRSYVETIRASGESLLRILNDV